MAAQTLSSPRLGGILSPVITPFTPSLDPDVPRFLRQCRWLLSNDVGLAVFGTNSEGNSLSVSERIDLLEAMAAAGLPMHRVLAGTGACSLTDAAAMTRAATALGCGGVLMLPPFYYKSPSDDGLFRFFAEVVAASGARAPSIYLYHISGVASVGFSLALIDRLLEAFAPVIRGIKDTGGDAGFTHTLLTRYAGASFDVFPGNETALVTFMEAGAAGCISATANVNPAGLVELVETYGSVGAHEAREKQARANDIRTALTRYPLIPALKAVLADAFDDEALTRVRPPLMPLSAPQREALANDLRRLAFRPPALRPQDGIDVLEAV
ncbi:dihydrodipicolinate synthase family protein [Pandoraea captiosa]|uniref:Dihydrodipicolinate synthase family protein n=1 Tax=Pandoraea captiosa TaxID=2508302 RepID=A0A5E4ZIP8_9BURK|nr:dihydrodipicolinate synthase family protein [Pandoraea captiosa]VVE60527.1 dihydrodipicolinate synthase family protein [Pandoraea captiosa]